MTNVTTPASEGLEVLVADDHPAMLKAITAVIRSSGIRIVADARDGEEAVAKIGARKPAVALVDIRMPRLSGVEVVRRAARVSPDTAVILYTGYADQALLVDALDAGARGFVSKEAPLDDIQRAIQIVAAGGIYVDPVVAGTMATAEVAARLPTLTARERDVLRLLADGRSNEEIGRVLFISPETVRTHVRKAMEKLEADTRTEAVAIALRQRLIA